MKLFGSTKSNITNVPHLQVTEVVLVHGNIVSNDSQQDLRVLYTFVHDKLFFQLQDISPKKFIFLNTFDS